jgi:hypothetical protein
MGDIVPHALGFCPGNLTGHLTALR